MLDGVGAYTHSCQLMLQNNLRVLLQESARGDKLPLVRRAMRDVGKVAAQRK